MISMKVCESGRQAQDVFAFTLSLKMSHSAFVPTPRVSTEPFEDITKRFQDRGTLDRIQAHAVLQDLGRLLEACHSGESSSQFEIGLPSIAIESHTIAKALFRHLQTSTVSMDLALLQVDLRPEQSQKVLFALGPIFGAKGKQFVEFLQGGVVPLLVPQEIRQLQQLMRKLDHVLQFLAEIDGELSCGHVARPLSNPLETQPERVVQSALCLQGAGPNYFISHPGQFAH
jgi:hypothetical protein